MKDHSKESWLQTTVLFCLFALILIIVSVVAFRFNRLLNQPITGVVDNFTFISDERYQEDESIRLENAYPMSDEEGIQKDVDFTFEILASTQTRAIYYEIWIEKVTATASLDPFVKTYLTTGTETEEAVRDPLNEKSINLYRELGKSNVFNQTDGRTLYQKYIPKSDSFYHKTFHFRMWLTEEGTENVSIAKEFSVKLKVFASYQKIPLPRASEPKSEFSSPSDVSPKVIAKVWKAVAKGSSFMENE